MLAQAQTLVKYGLSSIIIMINTNFVHSVSNLYKNDIDTKYRMVYCYKTIMTGDIATIL